MLELVLVARDESSEVVQPRIRALDDPAAPIPTEAALILKTMGAGLDVRRDQVDPTTAEAFPELRAVVATVGDDALRFLLRATSAGARHRYLGERFFREL